MATRNPSILYHDLLWNSWRRNAIAFNRLLNLHWKRYSDDDKRLLYRYCCNRIGETFTPATITIDDIKRFFIDPIFPIGTGNTPFNP